MRRYLYVCYGLELESYRIKSRQVLRSALDLRARAPPPLGSSQGGGELAGGTAGSRAPSPARYRLAGSALCQIREDRIGSDGWLLEAAADTILAGWTQEDEEKVVVVGLKRERALEYTEEGAAGRKKRAGWHVVVVVVDAAVVVVRVVM